LIDQEYYRKYRKSFLAKHDDGLMQQLSLSFAKRTLKPYGVELIVCSGTYFIDTGCSAIFASAGNYADIYIDANQIVKLVNESSDLLLSEAAIYAVAHELGHLKGWLMAEGQHHPDYFPEDSEANERAAWALGQDFAWLLTGRSDFPTSYEALRDRIIGPAPAPAPAPAAKKASQTESVTVPEITLEEAVKRLEAIKVDLEAAQARRKAQVATAAKKQPQKPALSASLAPVHIYHAPRPDIRVGGSVGCFG